MFNIINISITAFFIKTVKHCSEFLTSSISNNLGYYCPNYLTFKY